MDLMVTCVAVVEGGYGVMYGGGGDKWLWWCVWWWEGEERESKRNGEVRREKVGGSY